MISCEEAQHICDKAQYKEANLWERLKLSIHLLACKVCKEYTSNNGKLTNLCGKVKNNTLDKEVKSEMQEKIEDLLHQNEMSNT